jgi:hypothetical protein
MDHRNKCKKTKPYNTGENLEDLGFVMTCGYNTKSMLCGKNN